MTAYVLLLSIALAALVTAVVAVLRRHGFPRFDVRIPDPEPETDADQAKAMIPLSDISPPPWLTELEKLGFRVFESTDSSVTAAAPYSAHFVCVSKAHPHNTCTTCGAKAMRMLGETPMDSENVHARIYWAGFVCGRCGTVEIANLNAPRFLNLMLADSRSMLTLIAQIKQHDGKPFYEMIAAIMMQHENVLTVRAQRSSALRAGLPSAKLAKVLHFRKGKSPRKRRRDLL